LKKIYPELIMIDGGDMGESVFGPTVWKSAELFKTMHGLGYEAIGIGERDLAPPFFEEVAQSGAKDILLSGNFKPAADIGIAPARLIQRKSSQLGVVEVVSSFLQQGQSLEPKDPKVFLQQQLDALRLKKAEVTVVIYHGPSSEVPPLRQSFPGVDLWLVSHGVYQPMAEVHAVAGGAIIVGPGDRGREVGLITLEKKAGTRTGKFAPIILDDNIPDSPKAAPIQARFLKRSQSAVTPAPERAAEPAPAHDGHDPALNGYAENPYVGSEVCRLCHEDIYNKWRETKHAHALETLAVKKQSTNAECLRCHTVGFGEQTGFTLQDQQPYLAAVGCEMCHGRAGYHVRADDQTANFAPTSEATCVKCHDKTNSPKFVYATYLTKGVH
jgi:hypothetical protein